MINAAVVHVSGGLTWHRTQFKDGNVAQELHQTHAVLVLRYLFEHRLTNFDFFSKLRTAVYPPNMAPIDLKLWQNAFQTICNFSFFDAENVFWSKNIQKILEVGFCFQEIGVLEELWISERQWQVSRKKLLPELPLFLGRLPWRRGKGLNMCRKPRLGTENDFNHLVLWYYDIVIVW